MNIDIQTARAIIRSSNPTPLWESGVLGGVHYHVKKTGVSELRVYDRPGGDCLYRSTYKNGCWISSFADAGEKIAPHVGDNISLVLHFNGMDRSAGFLDALKLTMDALNCPVPEKMPPAPAPVTPRKPPYLPKQTVGGRLTGRRYLKSRGISDEVLTLAEKANLLSYCEGNENFASAVFFSGYDEKGVRWCIDKRIAGVKPGRRDFSEKCNIAGSDLAMVPFFRGSDTVFFVEGGVNLLSVLELYHREGKELPTVIMTSGQSNIKWRDNPLVADILENASAICIVGENDLHKKEKERLDGLALKERQKKIASELARHPAIDLLLPEHVGEIYVNDVNDIVRSIDETGWFLEYVMDRVEAGKRPEAKLAPGEKITAGGH